MDAGPRLSVIVGNFIGGWISEKAVMRALMRGAQQLAQRHRSGTVDTASTINVSAANAGIALGAFIGGLGADARLGLGATPCVGAIMVGAGLLLARWSWWLERRQALIEVALADGAQGR